MSLLSHAKNAFASAISLMSTKTSVECDDDDSPVEAYIYRVDLCDSVGDFVHHSFHTENEIYLPQQSLILLYSKSQERLYIHKRDKPRNERYTNTFTMAQEKTEMIKYFITRRQVNAIVDMHRNQEKLKAMSDRFVLENQDGIIEDLKQPKIGRASMS